MAFQASYPSVGGGGTEQPDIAAAWTLCDNLH